MSSPKTVFTTTDKAAPGHYKASQTALLLLDFHTMFVEQASGPSGPSAVKTAATMRTWAKSHGIQVIHCLIDVTQSPFETCKDTTRFQRVVDMMKSSGGDKEPAVLTDDAEGEVTFTRRPGYVSAMKSTGLEAYLKEKGLVSLVVAGLSTGGCVLRTSLAACDAEFVVTVLSDGCADVDGEVHGLLTSKVLSNRGYVVTSAEFREGFEKIMSQ